MSVRRAHSRWSNGWWNEAQRRASPNFDERPLGTHVSLAVVHSISLPPRVFGTHDVERLFTNTLDCSAHPYFEQLRGLRVSAHFFIRRDGQVLQFVGCDQRAWHAGVSCWRGRDRCNDFSIGIEFEGLEGERFAAPQYRSAARLLRALCLRYPIEDVVGHEHVSPGRKRDPGRGFDWTGLGKRVRSPSLRLWPRLEPAP